MESGFLAANLFRRPVREAFAALRPSQWTGLDVRCDDGRNLRLHALRGQVELAKKSRML